MSASPRISSQSLDRWAEETARTMLADTGPRLDHVLAVGEKAREVARKLGGDDGQRLIVSAFLHDIGYADQLVDTGLHQIDGARWLTDLGLPSIASMVAHHSEAAVELELRGREELLDGFERPDQRIADALTYCDVTTGPAGQDVSLDERIEDVGRRRGSDSPVYRAMVKARARYVESIERTLDLLGDQSNVASGPAK